MRAHTITTTRPAVHCALGSGAEKKGKTLGVHLHGGVPRCALLLIAASGIAVLSAAGIASAGGSASGVAPDAAMVVAKLQQGRLFFSPRSVDIASGGTLTIRNGAPSPRDEIVLPGGGAVPRRFTFSLVRQSLLPKTKRQRQRCDAPGHICYAILRWHHALDGTVDVRRVDVGQTGWDRAGGLLRSGDSLFFNRNGPRNGSPSVDPVSAPAGSTLYFLDAIHPWMQGRINVR